MVVAVAVVAHTKMVVVVAGKVQTELLEVRQWFESDLEVASHTDTLTSLVVLAVAGVAVPVCQISTTLRHPAVEVPEPESEVAVVAEPVMRLGGVAVELAKMD